MVSILVVFNSTPMFFSPTIWVLLLHVYYDRCSSKGLIRLIVDILILLVPDFIQEANNADRSAKSFAHKQGVRIPRIFRVNIILLWLDMIIFCSDSGSAQNT